VGFEASRGAQFDYVGVVDQPHDLNLSLRERRRVPVGRGNRGYGGWEWLWIMRTSMSPISSTFLVSMTLIATVFPFSCPVAVSLSLRVASNTSAKLPLPRAAFLMAYFFSTACEPDAHAGECSDTLPVR
jgi:hypothetical protein